MKIATWNINSVRKRTPHIGAWLEKEQPDFLLLQELKCQTDQFPTEFFTQCGYHSYVVGQKSYNGVAILARQEIEVTHRSLPIFMEPVARYIEIETSDLIIGNLYAPNGNSGGKEGYQHKLDFMRCLYLRAKTFMEAGKDFLFAGDFNICPTDKDLAAGTLAPDDALIRPASRQGWRALLWLGLTDAWRALHPHDIGYSFWAYQNMCWPRDKGLRIDMALLSPRIAQKLRVCDIDRDERDKEQPSDHVPLIVEFS